MLPGIEDSPRPRISVPARPVRTSSRRWIAGGLAGFVFLLASLYAFHKLEQFLIGDPRFVLYGPGGTDERATLEIAGVVHASSRALLTVFSEDLGRSVYLVPLGDRRSALRAADWVKDASVARVWPNRLLVSVRERSPVAFVTLGASRFGLIDEDGFILPPATDRFALPVLLGVRASDAVAKRSERVHRMLYLERDLGAAAAKISEIDVSDPDNLKITLPNGNRVVTLLLGDHNFAARYQNFVSHYSEIQRRLPGAATLDLRLEDRITVVE